MFTGIIQEIGKISNIESKSGKKYFHISCSNMQDQLKIGDSIACNGICLTVIQFDNQHIKVEAMNETLLKTTANSWQKNKPIHLERAMRLSDRLDGHIVQGHIDTVAKLITKQLINNTLYLSFHLDDKFRNMIVEQGSIAIDGVSLTVSSLDSSSFQVSLISHTLELTTFNHLNSDNYVNLEFDIIGKYVNRNLQKSKINIDWLKENGF